MFQIDGGLVVVCYRDGKQAHAHFMTRDQCEHYWQQWLERLQRFWNIKLCEVESHTQQDMSAKLKM